ncbi:tRNA1(Val) (adenine(37)-N6)-methyltransferase [Mycoplasmatota bacterium]|nr:tRNA1(Val) (adenine(37)-N6)-methyltransferase [Mycoplasmatota bacterium]
MLKENEVLNDLLGYDHLKIIQRPDMFNFSLDSTLLANFVTINKNVKKIVDLGTGNGPIPLFLSLKTKAKIIGVEIQEQSYDLAKRNIEINQLSNQIEIIHDDLKGIYKKIGHHTCDIVTCNPPYFKVTNASNVNKNDYLTIARHEVLATLEDVVKEASLLLKHGGYFSLVHRPDRLLDIFEIMRQYKIEPKRLRLVYPKPHKECNTVLIEGRKSNQGGLRILPPLYVYHDNNEYTEEIKKMFMMK